MIQNWLWTFIYLGDYDLHIQVCSGLYQETGAEADPGLFILC